DRLARGPLTELEAVRIGAQVAAALEAAHARGVMHRDLKPANIRLMPDGTVKVLDFGLAKALAVPEAPTMASAPVELTRAGSVLGTPSYMSPEQVAGEEADRRTDVWAFGCVLFECLSGRRLWSQLSVSSQFRAILSGTPDWRSLPSDTPPALRDLLGRCLEKEPDKRLAAMTEARRVLEEVLAGSAREARKEVQGNLPRRLTSFVGRERELGEIAS